MAVALIMSYSMESFLLLLHLCCLVWPLRCVSGLLRLDLSFYFPGRSLLPPLTFFQQLQVKKHTSYIMTIEMSFIGSMCLLASTFQSPDGEALRKYGFFHGWTLWTVVSTLLFCHALFPLAVRSIRAKKKVLRSISSNHIHSHNLVF